jgi:hypothetical protein
MTNISAEEPNVPRKMRERYEAITGITDEFCQEHLNEEYADLSRKMAAALSRKRPSPLESGRARSWIVEVNGLPVDVRMMPREVQEEAYRLGLIPYMP